MLRGSVRIYLQICRVPSPRENGVCKLYQALRKHSRKPAGSFDMNVWPAGLLNWNIDGRSAGSHLDQPINRNRRSTEGGGDQTLIVRTRLLRVVPVENGTVKRLSPRNLRWSQSECSGGGTTKLFAPRALKTLPSSFIHTVHNKQETVSWHRFLSEVPSTTTVCTSNSSRQP